VPFVCNLCEHDYFDSLKNIYIDLLIVCVLSLASCTLSMACLGKHCPNTVLHSGATSDPCNVWMRRVSMDF